MNTRLKEIRIAQNLTQVEFAERLSLTSNFVSLLEKGVRFPSDRTINDICIKFHIDENWLRTGEGNMYISRSRNQEIVDFMNDVIECKDDDFKKQLIISLTKLDEAQWKVLSDIAESFVNNKGTE